MNFLFTTYIFSNHLKNKVFFSKYGKCFECSRLSFIVGEITYYIKNSVTCHIIKESKEDNHE